MVWRRRGQEVVFSAGVTCLSRYFLLRSHLIGRLRPVRFGDYSRSNATRLRAGSGRAALDAVFVRPAAGDIEAAVLICHGIGELVEHWRPVQHLLALHGVGSLVFDYSGYGRSRGIVSPAGCEANAIAAFECLRALLPGVPEFLLGFSLGSGVACAVVQRVEVQSLVLCAAFTSFRAAIRRMGAPAQLVPPIWDNELALTRCSVPLLVTQGDQDKLFPVEMARRLGRACASPARLLEWPGLAHDDPFVRPDIAYWREVAEHVRAPSRR